MAGYNAVEIITVVDSLISDRVRGDIPLLSSFYAESYRIERETEDEGRERDSLEEGAT